MMMTTRVPKAAACMPMSPMTTTAPTLATTHPRPCANDASGSSSANVRIRHRIRKHRPSRRQRPAAAAMAGRAFILGFSLARTSVLLTVIGCWSSPCLDPRLPIVLALVPCASRTSTSASNRLPFLRSPWQNPSLSPRRKSACFATENTPDDRDKKNAATSDNDDASSSSLSRLFSRTRTLLNKDSSADDKTKRKKRVQKRDDDRKDKMKGLPIVGRLFSGNEAESTDDDDDDDGGDSSSSLMRIFQKRKILSDAEVLRQEVLRQEEERQRRATEQTAAAQKARRQSEVTSEVSRQRKLAEQKRQAEVDRKVQAQRLADQQRQARLEAMRKARQQKERPAKIRAQLEIDRRQPQQQQGKDNKDKVSTVTNSPSPRRRKTMSLGNRIKAASAKVNSDDEDETDAPSTSSSRFMSVVQKSVMGLFDTSDKEEWVVVAPKTRISPGESVPITVAGIDLLLVASKDGSALHCIANSCPHLGTPLELGTLERRPIENRDGTMLASGSMGAIQETDIARMLKEDGCEDCIVCPLHKTAFALESGEVRGEWCPYPPVIGKLTGAIKKQSNLPVFDVRARGKNIEVRLNTPFRDDAEEDKERKETKDNRS